MFDPLLSPALQHYPQDYQSARDNILNALQQQVCPLRHEAIQHEVLGANGETLFTDIAWLGAEDAANVLVLISATHGVEGFAGSAIQHDTLLQLAHTALPTDMAVVIIHALNPWGFSHQRRVNEQGIDLNRNGVDFQKPLPDSPAYAHLANALIPTDGDWATADRQLHDYLMTHGDRAFRRAVAGGQYSYPQGLFYGGMQASFSRLLIERKLAEWQLDQRQVVALDLHTGLGPFGHGELICDHPANSTASRKAQAWFGALVTLPETGDSCSVPLVGLMDYLWHAALREDGLFLTLEYGTYPFERLLNALRRDHWLYAQTATPDFNAPPAQAIRAELREIFNPDSALWRESVLLRSRQVIRTAWQGLQYD